MSNWLKYKTFKRETALMMFLFLCYLAWKGDRTEELEILVWPFCVYIGAAAGMHWASKQTNLDLSIRKEEEEYG